MPAAIIMILTAMLSIQTGAGLAKSLFPVAGAAGTTSLRLFFATVILWAIWKPWRHRFEKSAFKTLCIYGASLGIMNLAFYFALERIPLGIAVSLEFIGPLAIALLASRKAVDFLWAALAALGIYFVMPHAEANQNLDFYGCALALIAGAFWAFYIHFGKKAGKDLHGGIATTVGMTVAALVAAPVGFFKDSERLFSWKVIPMGLAVAVLSSALPYSLEMLAMKRMPAKTFGIFMSVEPAIASMVGLLLLGEVLLPIQWMAILCIMLASFGSTWTASREQVTFEQAP